MFAVSYTLLVALLFEPPLPADAPADDAAWRAAHKASLLITTWLAFVLPADVFPRAPGYEGPRVDGDHLLKAGQTFFRIYFPLVMAMWAAVHILMPARAFRRRRGPAGGPDADAGAGKAPCEGPPGLQAV